MPSVFSFWQLPDEEPGFLEKISRTGKLIALPMQKALAREELRPRPLDEVIRAFNPDIVAFGLEQHSHLIQIASYSNEQGKFYTLSLMSSPLVACTRPRWRSPLRLGMSNLAAYGSYPADDRAEMVDHPKEFIRWAKKVFRRAREYAPRWPEHNGQAMTQQVAAAITQGLVTVP